MADAQLPQDDTRTSLIQHDAVFRDLVQEHHALDEHLRQLSGLTHLTEQQQYERVALKKRKLALKDRIAATLREGHVAGETA